MLSNPFRFKDFYDLPKGGEPDYLIDTAKANREMAQRNRTPIRRHNCDFNVPKDISRQALRQYVKEALETFIGVMDKNDWVLYSGFTFSQMGAAIDLEKGVLPDHVGYRASALFRKVNVKPVRLEIPPDLVKRDPEHRIGLKQAMHAW